MSLGLALVSGEVYAGEKLAQLNTQVKDMLSRYQSTTTSAHLNFNSFEFEEDSASPFVEFALNGLYRKIGSKNTVELKIDNFSYNKTGYHDLMFIFKGSIGMDLRHSGGPRVSDWIYMIISQLLTNYMQPYENAGTIKFIITSNPQNGEDENYTIDTAVISARIDLSKLPQEIDKESVQFTELTMTVTVEPKKGIMIDAYLVKNFEYTEFLENERKVKEIFNSVLSGNPEKLEVVHTYIEAFKTFLDQFAPDNSLKFGEITKLFGVVE